MYRRQGRTLRKTGKKDHGKKNDLGGWIISFVPGKEGSLHGGQIRAKTVESLKT